MNEYMLMDAINDISEEYVISAGRRLGRLPEARVVNMDRRERRLRIAFIAAALTALALAACTAALLGLNRRVAPAPDPMEAIVTFEGDAEVREPEPLPEGAVRGYLSPYGRGDSPEAKANAEWSQFWNEYTREMDRKCLEQGLDHNAWLDTGDDWYQGDETLTAARKYYNAYNMEMAEKLLETADKYGLELHKTMTFPLNMADLCRVTGAEPFLLAEDDSMFVPMFAYEDGSFTCEGDLNLADGRRCIYYIDRIGPGYIVNAYTYINNTEEYIQWEYTTAAGYRVELACTDIEADIPGGYNYGSGLCFYEENGWTVTVLLHFDDYVEPEDVELAAEMFDFSALCIDRSRALESAKLYIEAGPTESASGQAISVKELMASPEWKAAIEFDRAYGEYLTDPAHGYSFGSRDVPLRLVCHQAWPSGEGELDTLAEEIYTKYGLKPASSSVCMDRTEIIPPELVFPEGLSWPTGDYEPVTTAETYRRMGCEPFIDGAVPFFTDIYSNGCFRTCFTMGGGEWDVHYIRKGAFYTALGCGSVPPEDMPAWKYDAAWGGTVTIATDDTVGAISAIRIGDSYILYETEQAYVVVTGWDQEPRVLEALIDCVDLSKLD